jgi:hypothetical protein
MGGWRGDVQAAVAIVAGLVVSVVLFVPFVALSYRHRGGLTAAPDACWRGSAAAIYFWAIWAYTLLPLPRGRQLPLRRATTSTRSGSSPSMQRGAWPAGGNPLRRNRDVQQLVLNVALFTPLGFFLRDAGGAGASWWRRLAGLGVSAMVEFTQLTGVWGLYPCAYRVFDVVDLETNTPRRRAGLASPRWPVPGSVAAQRSLRPEAGAAPPGDPGTPAARHAVRRAGRNPARGLGTARRGGHHWRCLPHRSPETRRLVPDGAADRGRLADVVRAACGRLAGADPGHGPFRGATCAVQLQVPRAARQPEIPLARLMRALGGVVPGTPCWGWPRSEAPSKPRSRFAALLALVTVVTPRQGRGLPGLLSGQDPGGRPRDARGRRPSRRTRPSPAGSDAIPRWMQQSMRLGIPVWTAGRGSVDGGTASVVEPFGPCCGLCGHAATTAVLQDGR